MTSLYCSACEFGIYIGDEEALPDYCPDCGGMTWVDLEWVTKAELEAPVDNDEVMDLEEEE